MHRSIPAGVGEKMQYIVHPFNDNTIRFVLRYPCRLDADALQQATLALISRVEVLHAAFESGKVSARWQVQDASAEDCFTLVETPGDPMEAAFTHALAGIDAGDPVKLRCILVQGAVQSAITVLISHLCVDGSDGKYLLRKLCEAYRLLREDGCCDALQVKNGSRAAEQVYAGLTREERMHLLKDPRTGIKSVFPFPTDDPGEPQVLRRMLPPTTMAAAHERCKAADATLNDLLLTACYYAYVEATGAEKTAPVSIMSMMDLRRHCEGGDSQGLCNLTGALATALPDGLAGTFTDTLREIAAQTRRAKEDPFAGLYGMPLLHGAARRLPMKLLLSAASRLYGSMAVGLTNVGRIGGDELRMDGHAPAEGCFGGPIKRKPGVQLSCASFGGECALSLWGYAAQGDLPRLTQLLDSMAGHISAFASGSE